MKMVGMPVTLCHMLCSPVKAAVVTFVQNVQHGLKCLKSALYSPWRLLARALLRPWQFLGCTIL